MDFQKKIVIITGGQTGVDRAAMDVALQYRFPLSGWCPKGRLAEDGTISDRYPLRETTTSEYSLRTLLNIKDSDATLFIYDQFMDEGTDLAFHMAKKEEKPIYLLNTYLNHNPEIQSIVLWLKKENIQRLNIAGPRESKSPGIYDCAAKILSKLLNNILQYERAKKTCSGC